MNEIFAFNLLGTTAFIIFVTYIVAGIVDATCGGGGLITVPSLMGIGMPVHMVVGTNQCTLVLGCWTSFYEYAKSDKIDYRVAKIAVPFSLAGAFIGSELNLLIDERYLQIIMIVLIPIMAIIGLIKNDMGKEDRSDEVSERKIFISSALIGFIVSTYHAFYGPASGIFYLAAFVVFLKHDAVKANGIGRCILAFVNVASGIVYAVSGFISIKSVAIGTVGYIIGNYIGAKLALKKGIDFIRPVYYLVVVGLMIKLITTI